MVDSRFINNYPYTDFHEMNLDWIITQTEALTQKVDDDKDIIDNVNELKNELDIVKKLVEDFDTSYIEKIVKEYLATMIFVEISDSGYIIYNIPSGWNSIIFNTTGLDIDLAVQSEYGHLVLSY